MASEYFRGNFLVVTVWFENREIMMDKRYGDDCCFLIDDQGKPVAVFMLIETYMKIMSDLEDYQDILIADKAYADFTEAASLEEAIDRIKKID